MHSADRVLAEFQHPEVGDTIGRSWRSEDGNWVGAFSLIEHDGRTRLIGRNRFRLSSLAARIAMLPMEPGSLVMERRMLMGIKRRAEELAAERP